MPIVSGRYVSEPQDNLEIVRESAMSVVLKIEAWNPRTERTEQFEFELNSKQLATLLTFGATQR